MLLHRKGPNYRKCIYCTMNICEEGYHFIMKCPLRMMAIGTQCLIITICYSYTMMKANNSFGRCLI